MRILKQVRKVSATFADGALPVAAVSLLLSIIAAEGTARVYFSLVRPSAVEFLERSDDPELSFQLRRSHKGSIHGFQVQTNEGGFRDAPWQDSFPSADTKRVLVIGDSIAFGWSVNQDEAFPAVLEKQLRAEGKHVRVFNLSVPGYGLEQHLRLLDLYRSRLHPDLVLIAYCLNDPDPVGGTEAHSFFHPPRFETWNLFTRVRTRLEIALAGGDYHRYIHNRYSDALRAYFERLGEAQAQGTKIALFIVPAFMWHDGGYPYVAIHQKLSSYAQAKKIAVIDTPEPLLRFPTSEVAVDGWHPNATGHELLASIVKASSVTTELFEPAGK